MNTAFAATISSTVLTAAPSAAVSAEAGFIQQRVAEPYQMLRRSTAFGHSAMLEELWQVVTACSRSGWDGFGAEAVAPRTISYAVRFIDALPLGLRPSIGAEPDGHLTFEWYASPRRVVSISIGPDGDLHYAAIVGASRQYGVEPFVGELPPVILKLISRVKRA